MDNLYRVFSNNYRIYDSFGLRYVKDYLRSVYHATPKKTVLESYMTAGYASPALGHPQSAVLDYRAGLSESRTESGDRTLYLLETSCLIALPLDTTVRILVTSEDVIHS